MHAYASGRDRAATPPQRGAAAVVFMLMLAVMLGFIGMALDLAQLYNRRMELQSVADGAALAAAGELIGSATGVSNAMTQAATAAARFHYQYGQQPVAWSNSAIKFSNSATTADSGWLDAASAQAAPDGLMYVKVDTSALAPETGAVITTFMAVLSPGFASASTRGRAIAGRTSILAAPLAICAMSATPAASRGNAGPAELVEYGFRRGVAYDLMQLNPNAGTPESFLIDPLDPPGTLGAPANLAAAVVGPFVCNGSMQIARLKGGSVTLQRPFPLAQLYQQLNSRFDQYTGGLCTPNGAPPDFNIKAYASTGSAIHAAIPWMTGVINGQASDRQSDPAELWTKADLSAPASNANSAAMYGPLWSFAKAVPFSDYAAGVPEPAAGYAPFAPTATNPATLAAWANLYVPNPPTSSGYTTVPYLAISGTNFQAPSAAHPGIRGRRVLNIPLLSCPVAAGANASATVVGVGRFFMTVPASATSLYAEFAGSASEQALGGPPMLYP